MRIGISDPGLSSAADNQFNGWAAHILDRSTREVLGSRVVGDFDDSNNYIFVDDYDFTPTTSMDYRIDVIPASSPTAGDVTSVNVLQISGSATAADNLESAYDGTGYDLGGIDVSELNQIVDDLINGGRLDLLIDAIKAKTDSLTFTVAGEVDSNAKSMNDVTIGGTGQASDKWTRGS